MRYVLALIPEGDTDRGPAVRDVCVLPEGTRTLAIDAFWHVAEGSSFRGGSESFHVVIEDPA
jgi:hypothetical protein